MKRNVDVEGKVFGVDFVKRGENDNHVLLHIHLEDDGDWFPEFKISSGWIDDMIDTLIQTKNVMDSKFIKNDKYGYKFKE